MKLIKLRGISLKQQVEDLQDQMTAKDQELVRMKERQTFSREYNFDLREKNNDLKKQLSEANEDLRKTREIVEAEFTEKIQALVEEISILEERIAEQDNELENLKAQASCHERKLEKKEGLINKQSDKIESLEAEVVEYQMKQSKAIEKERQNALKELRELRSNMDKKSQAYDKVMVDKNELQKMAENLDKQASEFERLFNEKKVECEKLLKEKTRIEMDRNGLKSIVDNLKKTVSGEQGRTDQLLKDYKERIKVLEANIKTEKDSSKNMTRNFEKEKTQAESNVKRLAVMQQELDRCVQEANEADERAAHLEEEIRELKEEASRHISEVLTQKSKTSRMKSSLNEANEKINSLEARIQSLLTEMEKNRVDNDTEVYRLSERLRQHHELENEMMKRIEKLEKAKKPLIAFNSPAPSRKPSQSIRNVRDFEIELEKEREQKRKMQEELIRTETELLDLKLNQRVKRMHYSDQKHEAHDEESHASLDPSAPEEPPSYIKFSQEGLSTSISESSIDNNMEGDEDDSYESDDPTVVSPCLENHEHRHTINVDVHRGATSTVGSSQTYTCTRQSSYKYPLTSPYKFNRRN